MISIRMKNKLQRILSQYKRNKDELLPILLNIQEEMGYIPLKILPEIAKYLYIPESKIFSVATFYDRLHLERQGKYRIQICSGTACYVNKRNIILKTIKRKLGILPGQITQDRKFSLENVPCFGLCASGPVMVINNKVFSRMTPKKAERIIDEYKKGKKRLG